MISGNLEFRIPWNPENGKQNDKSDNKRIHGPGPGGVREAIISAAGPLRGGATACQMNLPQVAKVYAI